MYDYPAQSSQLTDKFKNKQNVLGLRQNSCQDTCLIIFKTMYIYLSLI